MKPRSRMTLEQVAVALVPICGVVDWREARGFSNHFVSSGGHVWSCRSQRLVIGSKVGGGYRRIQRKTCPSETIHRIVCRTFHGDPIAPRNHVRHLDGNLNNNHADNLAWGTRRENEDDKERHGTVLRGDRCPASKLTSEQVAEMRRLYAAGGVSHSILGRRFGVSAATAHRAVIGETWRV